MKTCKRVAVMLIFLLTVDVPLLRCVCATANAHAVPENGRTGTITVTMRYDGKPLPDGELTIYQVGKVDEEDGNYFFRAKEKFQKWDEAFRNLEDAEVDVLAVQLAEFVTEEKLAGTHVPVDEYGKAKFDDDGHGLKQGLYLVMQTVPADGFEPISPFLVSLPYFDGEEYVYDVTAAAKNELEQTTETTAPPESTKPPSPGKPSSKLPQTGQLNWPVPVMVILGMALFAMGWMLRFRKRDDNAQ